MTGSNTASGFLISPSGNYYGSEQVLHDYLKATKLHWTVAVPQGSIFAKLLAETLPDLKTVYFNRARLPFLYAKLAAALLIGKYKVVYVNEGGHSRYLTLLARYFRKTRFLLHIRMFEDTLPARWPAQDSIPDNLKLIAISGFIAAQLNQPAALIYDSYDMNRKERRLDPSAGTNRPLVVGIVGRVTPTKGIARLPGLIDALQQAGFADRFTFRLFGEISAETPPELLARINAYPQVQCCGLEMDKDRLYHQLDLVLHLSTQEAWGRIYTEALSYALPFAGIKAGGIAEIGELAGLSANLAEPGEALIPSLCRILTAIANSYPEAVAASRQAKALLAEQFHPSAYAAQIDQLANS